MKMVEFTMEAWSDFFVAEVGAAGVLAGLVFVAISINLGKILTLPGLPSRAAEALVLLIGALVMCSIGLVPHQPMAVVGLEFVGVGLFLWGFSTVVQVRNFGTQSGQPLLWKWVAFGLGQAATLPFIASGGLLVAHSETGLYALALGVMFCVVAGVMGAWVMMVEIVR